MNDDELIDTEEIEIRSEEPSVIDEVMREALEAIEKNAAPEGEDPVGGEGGGDAPASPVPEGADELMGLRREVEEHRDRAIRTLADFENFRKRTERERQDERRYAGADVLRDVLSVVDNLERALEAEGSLNDLKEGVDLIHRQVLDLLKRHQVERVPSTGHPFDPLVHEAVAKVERGDVSEPTIVREMQAGYWIGDRLLRPSMVEVAMPEAPSGPQADDDEDQGGTG